MVGPLNLLRVLEGLAQAVASEDRSAAEKWRGQLVDHLGRHSASLRRTVNELYEEPGNWQRKAADAPDSKQIYKLISRFTFSANPAAWHFGSDAPRLVARLLAIEFRRQR